MLIWVLGEVSPSGLPGEKELDADKPNGTKVEAEEAAAAAMRVRVLHQETSQ